MCAELWVSAISGMGKRSGTAAKGEAGSAGRRSGVPAAASASARATIRRASSILKALSPEGLASASAASAARRKAARVGARARQDPLRRRGRATASAATPPSAMPRFRDHCRLEPQRSRGGDDREGIGRALADLEIARMRRRSARPPPAGARATISSPGSSTVSRSRRIAGQPVKRLRARPRAGPPCPRSRRRRRARRAARRNPRGASRCSCSLQPSMACSRLSPPRASQPAPGSRLLQALAGS